MELTANYGLVLPKNYVSINETQMEYVDGGWKIDGNICRFTIYLTNEEAKCLAACGYIASVPAALYNGFVTVALASAASIVAVYNQGYGVSIRYGLFTVLKVSTLSADYWKSGCHLSSSGLSSGGSGHF